MPEEEKRTAEPEVRVTDRRSFTSDGERRAPDQPRAESPRTPVAAALDRESEQPEEGEQGHIGFENFTQYLGQVALHQMAGTRDPATGEVIVSLEEAQQTIEILEMLKAKTRSNLTAREAGTLDRLLAHLKLEYARRAAAPRR